MAFKLADRIRETSVTTGTADLSLAGTITGYKAFSALLANGDTCWYTIVNGSQWETGLGTYASTGNILQRTTIIESSNSNAKVNLSAGTKDVFVSLPGSKAVGLSGASETLAGVVELATPGESAAGVDTSRAATPAGIAAAIAALSPGSSVVLQTFITSGTFAIEANDIGYYFEMWGGGGGGLSNGGYGGGGGGYIDGFVLPTDLQASNPVVIGAGGAGGNSQTSTSAGDGGNSTFAGKTALGGKQGGSGAGGMSGDGGQPYVTLTSSSFTWPTDGAGGGRAGSNSQNQDIYRRGAFSLFGGGGGGGSWPVVASSGTNIIPGGGSAKGGAGGFGYNGPTPGSSMTGTAPGGGGGTSGSMSIIGGAGARGEVRIYRFKK